jgi:type IV pilus assembly protein PilZ
LVVVDLRRYSRTQLEAPLEFTPKGPGAKGAAVAGAGTPGVGRDISVGGMFVETGSPPPFGAEVSISVQLPGQKDRLVLPAVVRWTRPDGMGVQFGLLGARETYAITEYSKPIEE